MWLIADCDTPSCAAARVKLRSRATTMNLHAQTHRTVRHHRTAHYSGGLVTFEPGARSAWHVHPAGQHLIVTEGVGRTGVWDGPVVEIKAGDALWCPPGVKHWHGATPGSSMAHIALTGVKDGKNVEWMEKVSDEQYGR